MKRRSSRSHPLKLGSPVTSVLLTRLAKLDFPPEPVPRAASNKKTSERLITTTSISGQVIEEKSGLPLAGVMVKWTLIAASGRSRAPQRIELGSAVTDDEGRFVIDAERNPEAKAALCGAQVGGEEDSGTTYLSLADRNGKAIGRPLNVSSKTREIILHPPAPEQKPNKQQWKALTNFLTTNRLMLVRDVAQQLVRPFADSPVRNWEVSTRTSALRALLSAVATKNQNLARQTDLLEQNQFVETESLGVGNLRRAVTYFKGARRLDQYVGVVDKIFPWLRQSDRQLYRDYLRGIWVSAAQMMWENEEHITKPAVALLERQLDERFMQDFHTNNDATQPAAKLLAPLLTSILERDSARGGFGLKPADIPAQAAQTDDEYLETLIARSKVSAKELRNRLRVSFNRNPGETTSPLQLNVEALLGLLADTYQSPEEPFNAMPAIFENGKPLIFGPYIGRAPFFLEYEEWLERQRTFFPENIYDIRKNAPVFYPEFGSLMKGDSAYTGAPYFPGQGYFDHDPGERARSAAWVERMFPIVDRLREAFAKIDGQLYPDALAKLQEVSDLLKEADKKYEWPWVTDKFWWQSKSGSWNNVPAAFKKHYLDVWISLVDRAKIKVTTPEQLDSFERFFEEPVYNSDYEVREKGLAKSRTLYHYGVFYLNLVLIPYLRAQIYFGQGDFAKALTAITPLTGYRVGIAETTSAPGYATLSEPLPGQDQTEDSFARYPRLHHLSTLPYTTLVGFTQDKGGYEDLPAPVGSMGAMVEWKNIVIAPFEQRFFKLAQGEIMLAWADQLYRNDDPSSIRRARELYKGLLFMHGEDPEIAPHFPRDNGRFGLGLLGQAPIFWKFTENPAKVSQITRARLALFQIEQGLNVYGYREDMVPVLRYKPLKQAADLFATSAKSAQTDFLNYMTRYEQALIELWQTQSLVKKAQASSGIASEHVAIAQVGVDKAKEQVAAVQAQIAAKKKEIADKNSLFEQFSDYLSGAKDALQGMVPLAGKVMAEESGGAAAAGGDSVTGEQMLNIFSKGASGGSSEASDAAGATLGSGAAFMIGYGAFVYASYNSMEAMASADAKRTGELKALETTALDAANAQVRLKQRDVAIAQYEAQIAAADLEFARVLFRFQQDRFLNADFWNKLTQFASRLMRRYVELGARTAWFAERALAFEQNRAVAVIKLNYLPVALRGVTGADRLLADLAELEANRIQGVRLTTPVKHTISLAREFPLAFGQLKKTGRCRFHTRETDLRAAYPGTFAYRIRALTVAVHDTDGAAPRGLLRNGGVSEVSGDNLSNKVLVRYPDALALSEFRLHDDLFVYGLPDETLMQFEGSGFETDWELQFPVVPNPKGLRSVADVLITFDSNAYYSDAVAAKQAAQTLADAPRSIMLAASNTDPKGLASLKAAAGAARITFDPIKLALPAQEVKRQITNLALICVGKTTKKYNARLTASKSAKTAAFKIADGLATSNDGPLLGSAAPLPLNGLVGLNLNQPLVLEIDRAGVADELKQLFDVVLYLEYTASY